MTLALLCQFTAQYVSDVNTSLYRSLPLRGVLMCWCYVAGFLLVMWYPSALGYHITNTQSRYITPTRLTSAQYSLHNNATSSCKLLKRDVLTSGTCWAVNLHNKATVIKMVFLFSNMNSLLKELFCISEAPLDVLKFVLWFIIGDLNFPIEQRFCFC